jgi:hypothetical protein
VVGLLVTIEKTLDLVQHDEFALAIINVILSNGLAYNLAGELKHWDVPFALASGYSAQVLPVRFSDVPLLVKPFDAAVIIGEAQRLCTVRQRIAAIRTSVCLVERR